MGFVRLLTVVAVFLAPVSVAQAASFAAEYKLELFVGDPLDPFGDDSADAVGSTNVNQFSANSPDFAVDLVASIVFDGVTFDYPSGQPFTF